MRIARPIAIVLALAAGASPAVAKGKDRAPPPKTGKFQVGLSAGYLYYSVPETYDAKAWWPVLFVLHPLAAGKPEPFVDAWAETALGKRWIIVSRAMKDYFSEESIKPLQEALTHVETTYHVDARRVVIAGHNDGANMAWSLAAATPDAFAAVAAFDGEIPSSEVSRLKTLAGKPVYLFRGAKDTYYTQAQADRDRKLLEAYKVDVKTEVLKDWSVDFPRPSIEAIAKWVDGVWPPGSYREKADEAEKALRAGDLPAAYAALGEVGADLKKHPYAAFEEKRQAIEKAFLEAGRAKIAEAKKLLDGGQPLLALDAAEAATKALKGLAPLDREAAQSLDALKKDPNVRTAVRKKEAESSAASYMEKAEAAEAKGDLAKALDGYRRVVALGDTSRKADAERKIAEIEPKVPAK